MSPPHSLRANVYPTIELRLLQYVVTVADELSFTQAAKKLYVSQPVLSRKIRELETALGVELFERSTRRVTLTKAGQVFVEEARAALSHSERAQDLAKALSQRETAPLLVGFSPHANFDLLTAIKRRATACFGNDGVAFVSSFTPEQVQNVLDGKLDVGLGIGFPQDPALETHLLINERVGVILAKDHPLCKRSNSTVRLEELKNIPVISLPGRLNPDYYREVRKFWDKIGYNFEIQQEVSTIPEAIALVSAGLGMSFTKVSTGQIMAPTVKMLSLAKDQSPDIPMTAFLRKNGHSTKVEKFLKLLQSLTQK